MVHQPSGGIQVLFIDHRCLFVFSIITLCFDKKGQATDIMIHAEEILKLKRVVNRLYVKHTGQTIEEIGKRCFI
jgi:hypothetical protein